MELDISRFSEQCKTRDLKKSGNVKKIANLHGDTAVRSLLPEQIFETNAQKVCKNIYHFFSVLPNFA